MKAIYRTSISRIICILGVSSLVARAAPNDAPRSLVEETSGRAEKTGDLNAAGKGYAAAAAQTQAIYEAQTQANQDKLEAMVKIMKVWGADVAAKFPPTWLKDKQNATNAGYVQTLRQWNSENLATGLPGMNPQESAMVERLLKLIGGGSGLSDAQKRDLLSLVEKYLASSSDKDKARDLKIDVGTDSPDVTLQQIVSTLRNYAKSGGSIPTDDLASQLNSILQEFHGGQNGAELSYLAATQRVSRGETSGSLNSVEAPASLVASSSDDNSALNRLLTLGLQPKTAPEVFVNTDRAPASVPNVDAPVAPANLASNTGGGSPFYYGGGIGAWAPRDAQTGAPVNAEFPGHSTSDSSTSTSSNPATNHNAASDFPTPVASNGTAGGSNADASTDSLLNHDTGAHDQPIVDDSQTADNSAAKPTTQPSNDETLANTQDNKTADQKVNDIFEKGLTAHDTSSATQAAAQGAALGSSGGITGAIIGAAASVAGYSSHNSDVDADIQQKLATSAQSDISQYQCNQAEVAAALNDAEQRDPQVLNRDDALVSIVQPHCKAFPQPDDGTHKDRSLFLARIRTSHHFNRFRADNSTLARLAGGFTSNSRLDALNHQLDQLTAGGLKTADDKAKMASLLHRIELATIGRQGDVDSKVSYVRSLSSDAQATASSLLGWLAPRSAGHAVTGAMATLVGPGNMGNEMVAQVAEAMSYDAFNVKADDPHLIVGTPFGDTHAGTLFNPSQTMCSNKPKPQHFEVANDYQATYGFAKRMVQSVHGQFASAKTDPALSYLQASAVALNEIAREGACMAPQKAQAKCVQLQLDDKHEFVQGSKVAYQFLNNLLDYSSVDSASVTPIVAMNRSRGKMAQVRDSVAAQKTPLRPASPDEAGTDAADLIGGFNNFFDCLQDPASGASKFLMSQEPALRAYVAANCQDSYAQAVEDKATAGKLKTMKDLSALTIADDAAPLAKPTTSIPEPNTTGLEGFRAYYRNFDKDNVGAMQNLCKAMRTRYRLVLGLISTNKSLANEWLKQVTPVTKGDRLPAHTN